jgi:hypothetical protein
MKRLFMALAPLALVSGLAAGCGSQPDAKVSNTDSTQEQAKATPAPDFVMPAAGRALEHGVVEWNLYNRTSGLEAIGLDSKGATVRSFTLDDGPEGLAVNDRMTGGSIGAPTSDSASVHTSTNDEQIATEVDEFSDSAKAYQANPDHAYGCGPSYAAVIIACGAFVAECLELKLACWKPGSACIVALWALEDCTGMSKSCGCATVGCGWGTDLCTGQTINCGNCPQGAACGFSCGSCGSCGCGSIGGCSGGCGGCGGCGGGGGCLPGAEMDTCLSKHKHKNKAGKHSAASRALQTTGQ